jgi:hypothetical protein
MAQVATQGGRTPHPSTCLHKIYPTLLLLLMVFFFLSKKKSQFLFFLAALRRCFLPATPA